MGGEIIPEFSQNLSSRLSSSIWPLLFKDIANSTAAPVDLKPRQIPGAVQPPVSTDAEGNGVFPGSTTQINHGLDDPTAPVSGGVNGFPLPNGGDFNGVNGSPFPNGGDVNGENGSPLPNGGGFNGVNGFPSPNGGDFNGVNGFPSPNGGDFNGVNGSPLPNGGGFNGVNGSPLPNGGDTSGVPTDVDPLSSVRPEANGVQPPSSEVVNAAVPNPDPSVPIPQNSNGEPIAGNTNNGGLPASDTLDLQSLLTGDPEQDQPLAEIFQGIQEVQTFPVNEDGTLSDDDIDDLRDILKDDEEQIENLVDQGRLSEPQGKLLQAEIDPLKTGLDRIDDISIDTGDRIVGAGKTVATVVNPVAGMALTVLDEIGVLEPVGNFLGNAFDATIGKIF